MRPEDRIEQLAESLGMKAFVRRELRQLPELLDEGEQVLSLTQGEYEGNQGLIAVTDRRMVFLYDGLARTRREDFPYELISSVECSTSLRAGTLTIVAAGTEAVIRNVMPKRQAEAVAETIRAHLGPAAASEPAPPPADDPFETLRKLGELRDAGVLTADEFEEKKRSILARI